jgi:hypothetical protein
MLKMSFYDKERAEQSIEGYKKHTGKNLGLTPRRE